MVLDLRVIFIFVFLFGIFEWMVVWRIDRCFCFWLDIVLVECGGEDRRDVYVLFGF